MGFMTYFSKDGWTDRFNARNYHLQVSIQIFLSLKQRQHTLFVQRTQEAVTF